MEEIMNTVNEPEEIELSDGEIYDALYGKRLTVEDKAKVLAERACKKIDDAIDRKVTTQALETEMISLAKCPVHSHLRMYHDNYIKGMMRTLVCLGCFGIEDPDDILIEIFNFCNLAVIEKDEVT